MPSWSSIVRSVEYRFIVVCDIVVFELLRGIAPWEVYRAMEQALTGVPSVRMDGHMWDRAFEVQRLLASHDHAVRGIEHLTGYVMQPRVDLEEQHDTRGEDVRVCGALHSLADRPNAPPAQPLPQEYVPIR